MQQGSTLSSRKISRIKFIVVSLFTFFFLIYVYTFLHEAGHALVGIGFGQTLTNFDINFWNFNPHVSMSGDLTFVQIAIRSVAGAGLPFIVWIGFMLLVPRKTNYVLDLLRFASSISIFFSLSVWVVLPVLFYFGIAPNRDDVIHFLTVTQLSPWILTVIGLTVCFLCALIIRIKIGNLREKLLIFKNIDNIRQTPGSWTTILVMTAIIIFSFGTSIIVNHRIVAIPAELTVPENYHTIAQIDLSSRAFDNEILFQFSLSDSSEKRIYFIVEDIDTAFIDLWLAGSTIEDVTILRGEDFKSKQGGGHWIETLPPGEYKIVLTAHKSSGILSLHSEN